MAKYNLSTSQTDKPTGRLQADRQKMMYGSIPNLRRNANIGLLRAFESNSKTQCEVFSASNGDLFVNKGQLTITKVSVCVSYWYNNPSIVCNLRR